MNSPCIRQSINFNVSELQNEIFCLIAKLSERCSVTLWPPYIGAPLEKPTWPLHSKALWICVKHFFFQITCVWKTTQTWILVGLSMFINYCQLAIFNPSQGLCCLNYKEGLKEALCMILNVQNDSKMCTNMSFCFWYVCQVLLPSSCFDQFQCTISLVKILMGLEKI